MLEFLKNNYKTYFLYFITLSNIPLAKIGMPHIYGKLISNLNKKKIDKSFTILIGLIFFWFFIQCIIMCSHYIRSRILPLFSAFIRTRMVDEIMERYKMHYEELQVGDTLTKIIKAPWLAEDIFFIAEDFVFRNIAIIVSGFFYLFYHNKRLGGIYILSMAVIIIICYFFVNDCKQYISTSETTYDKTHEEIEDTLSNLMSIYTSRKTEFEKKRISKLSNDIYEAENVIMKCNNKYRMFFTIVFLIIFIILNLYSFRLYKNKEITLEVLISIIIINYSLIWTFMSVYYDAKKFLDIKGRVDVFSDYINGLPNISHNNKLQLKNLKNIKVHFNNIGFYYKKDKFIVRNINLTFNNNDIIGLVGHIGSGKSTIAKLLVRLIEYQEGSIFINSTEINKINIDSLRDNIMYIPQHPKLFNRTLFNNIVYGINEKNIDENEIYKLIDKISIKSTSDKFKQNMFKKVGKNGSLLSGGQRQIVWLIRSILKNSKIIILDEPTSSLDNASKKQVINFIKEFSEDRIIILITHDSSLLKYTTRIVKMNNGKVVNK
jgi:ABC-type multidrug transport system fused ATPase/permease subunit